VLQPTYGLAYALQVGSRMTNKTKNKKTLRLNPETLRVLNSTHLTAAAGGVIRRDSDCDTCAERGC
jgi:hypothetical protein